LDEHYKIEHTSNHGAKFRGNQPAELGDLKATKDNYKFGAEPNMSPPGAISKIKRKIQRAEIPLVAKSHGPK